MRKSKSRERNIWTGERTIDSIINSRSQEFTAYLDTLPPDERARIEAAERVYVVKTTSSNSAPRSVLKDYNDSMLGIKENEPVEYRGFVV